MIRDTEIDPKVALECLYEMAYGSPFVYGACPPDLVQWAYEEIMRLRAALERTQ